MCSVTSETANEESSVSPQLVEIWENDRCKPPSVAIRALHNVINRYLYVTRPEQVKDVSGGNIDIIVFLDHHEGEEIFPQDVERRFGVTRSTASRVLALMERKGLVARESVPRDARLKRIVLTDKSRAIAKALRSNAKQMENKLLARLSDTEIRQFMHTLDVMQTNLVSTGTIGDESRYSRLDIDEVCRQQDERQDDEEGKEQR
ncbi:MarR family winged helix-turn-helix transcriptional regulator [Bifidobacterium sp.]|uniref:MarR family winged helix-turn-helix transcriptional regulator n=1 Tax=Bifidobacterium sp. TaxID=41200 RepID=UPI003D7D64AA